MYPKGSHKKSKWNNINSHRKTSQNQKCRSKLEKDKLDQKSAERMIVKETRQAKNKTQEETSNRMYMYRITNQAQLLVVIKSYTGLCGKRSF